MEVQSGLEVRIRSSLTALVLSFGLATWAVAEPISCPDPWFRVEAADVDHVGKLCEMAPEIRDTLNECGLVQHRTLTIEVVDVLSHPMGQCLAYFDCEYDLIRLTNSELYDSLLDQGSPYALLPALVMMRALLTHEMAHALAMQSAGQRSIDIVDQEYIAAALELELMPEEWRAEFLAAAMVEPPPKEGLINIWIYGFAPRKFASNAWQHFRLPANGCKLIKQLVNGESSFSSASHPELR